MVRKIEDKHKTEERQIKEFMEMAYVYGVTNDTFSTKLCHVRCKNSGFGYNG